MNAYHIIVLSLLFLGIIIKLILECANTKRLLKYQEFKIVVIGSVISMYISWVVIYMANIKPFIEPVFKNLEENHL